MTTCLQEEELPHPCPSPKRRGGKEPPPTIEHPPRWGGIFLCPHFPLLMGVKGISLNKR